MEKYLVQFKDLDDADARLFGRDHMIEFLRSNIIEEHYSNMGFIIEAIYRFDGSDKMTLLELVCDHSRDAGDDYIDYAYRVREPETEKTVASFTIRIDGRA